MSSVTIHMPAANSTQDITYLPMPNVREFVHLRFKLWIKREAGTAIKCRMLLPSPKAVLQSFDFGVIRTNILQNLHGRYPHFRHRTRHINITFG